VSNSAPNPVVLSVNQDVGIDPARAKGAAVHLNSMREAFSKLGAVCHGVDEPDDKRLSEALCAAIDQGPVDVIYERYALGKSVASRFADANGIPLVLEVNAPLADEQRRWRGGSNEADDLRHDTFAMQKACKVVAVSSDVARYSIQRGARAERLEVFPNGIDSERFNLSARKNSIRHTLIPSGRFVIGFHGRLRPWHGFDMLVQVSRGLLQRGSDIHLLVVGEGDFDELEQLPESRYTRIEWQPHNEVPRYVAACDVLPLTYQADMPCYFSPLKLTEAMACGVVPLVPDLGDLPDVVKHQETGLVYSAGDSKQLEKQLQLLIANRDLLESLGRKAARVASQNTWVSIAAHVLNAAAECNQSVSRDS
jgi:glycosyltransferase involved in cell wall biosynthesis